MDVFMRLWKSIGRQLCHCLYVDERLSQHLGYRFCSFQLVAAIVLSCR